MGAACVPSCQHTRIQRENTWMREVPELTTVVYISTRKCEAILGREGASEQAAVGHERFSEATYA